MVLAWPIRTAVNDVPDGSAHSRGELFTFEINEI
jgi:hypothetical protein